ncbi:hypothetical protein JCM19300_714 [Algibacter lectus]|uniref:Lipocalin-like domain-containing protein n=2 Tax=Algibacter lectus TaxID=221126 RepID=A0A090VD29_9FLAO|nr:hypothetical protein JCM19300_714 [Algibacter lectus]
MEILKLNSQIFMKNNYYLSAIIALFISLTSCSSSDSNDANTPSDMVSSKTWKIESKMLSPTINYGGVEIDDIMILESEETRNYSFKFNADGTFEQYDATGEVLFESTWSLNSDNTILSFGEPIVYVYPVVGEMGFSSIDIVSISSSKIVGTIESTFGEDDYELTITFI